MTTLYHGTLDSLVPAILREGLKPRGDRPSHDAYMDSASIPTFVYLTTSYGLAVEHACRISERTADSAAIAVFELELDVLNKQLIYPDEDYLRYEWNSDFEDWTLKEQLSFMERKRDTWKESLKDFKTIAYKSVIPAETLTDCLIPRWIEQGYRRKFPKRREA